MWQLLILAMMIFACGLEAAPDVSLAWDPSPDADVSGYRLNYGLESGVYPQIIDVGNTTTATVSGLAAGQTFYFVVTAYTAEGMESLPSNEVSFTQPLPQSASLNVQILSDMDPDFPHDPISLPGGDPKHPPILLGMIRRAEGGAHEFTVKAPEGSTIRLYGSSDLVTWTLLGRVPNPTGALRIGAIESSDVRSRYYRAAIE
jgi:hypothetical protein